MNIASLFIKRPIMTTLVMMAIVIFGLFAYRLLSVSDLPNVDFPTINVGGSLPGASPETMAAAVATPLEKQFSTIAGIDSMISTNSLGNTNIVITFDLSRNLDAAAQDVQAAIAKTASQLPPELPSPPSYQKVNPADQPVLYLAIHSPTLRLSDVDEQAETTVAQRLSMVSGVAQVQVYGAQKYAVRTQFDPRLLASRQIGIDEVANAIDTGNVNLPTGTLNTGNKAYTITATGQLMDAQHFRNLIVAYRNGNPVRLNEIGQVFDSVENNKVASWFNGQRAIILAIQRQPGTNTVEVVDSIKKLLPSLQQRMPGAMEMEILYDRSVSIRASLNGSREVGFTILSMTLSLATVFIPVLFMGGIIGRLLHEFAVTIMVAILVSGVVSISLTPMLCSRFLRNPEREEHGKWYRATERIFDRSRDGYRWSLNKALEHSFATLMVLVATLLLTGFLVAGLPNFIANRLPAGTPDFLKNGIAKGFLPNEDTGQLFASTEAAQGISFPEMAVH